EAKNSGSGVGIKTMNGIAGRSHIQVDGLIDLVGSIVNGQGMGEGLSAVASTIDVGGGRIIMDDDGTGSTNFGGGNSFAIRAYGEFATENYGIVNVNVEKESDTADAKAIGAGSNVTQIVGDFSTVGGMGTKGTINVGLSTADSYWYGDYSAGSGWGVTPGDYGCLNLWMSNGAKWEGYTRYATNLVMDSGATWYGYSYDNNALNLTLKNDASWTPSNAGVGSVTTGSVLNFVGAKGDEKVGTVNMSDENGVNVVVKNYSGDTTLLYKHDAAAPTNIIGGTFTIANAEEDSRITLVTDNTGIDTENIFVVNDVLNGLAQKLFYTGYIDGEENLNGYVVIAEGLTSASAAKRTADIVFDETTGQGGIADGSIRPEIVYPSEQEKVFMSSAITGDAREDIAYVKAGILDLETGEYNFTKKATTATVENHMIVGGPWLSKVSSAVSSVGQGNKTILNMNNNDLNIIEVGSSASTGIAAINNGVVEINDPGTISITTNGGGQTAALFANGGGEIYIHNADGSPVLIRSESNSSGSGVGIKTMNGKAGRSYIKIDGLIDLVGSVVDGQGMGEGLSAVASTIDVGGGRIIMDDDGTGDTNFGGGNSFAIRAYGEFVTKNYGIVNVNVEKESDAADAKAIGAGKNVTQIAGNFSTVGGMGTKGTINVGLSTADSFWYGNYSAGSGWGVTPGDYGCLNLWMSNGAKWEGYTGYATNLVMDTDATWKGYAAEKAGLQLELKNDAIYTASSLGKEGIDTSYIHTLKGAADGFNPGGIYMSDKNGVDVVVDNYSGNTVLFYTHNAEDPNEIIGGTFTIKSAEAGSAIKLQTDNSGIDMDNPDEVQGALDNMAHKLFYNGVTENPDNLSGVVEIAEGLLTTSASLKVGMIEYDAENNGQGMLASGSVETPEELKNPEIIYGDKETAMMRGAKSAMASTTMMWRAENNDIMKRMGDLRLNNGEKGLWAKYYGGKYEMDAQKANMSTSYKAYQLGYDAQVGDGWILGAAVSYNDGESTYTMGHGDESVVSLGIYGTWTGKDGQYFDVIAKRSKLSNEYTINNTYGHKLEADYDAWGTSLSAEYGKRFEAKSGFYVDPSVELTIGRVNGGSYDAQSDYLDAYGKNKALHVEQDDFDSVIGRIGLRLGQKLNNASYFAKLALAHEFNGDFTTTFKAEGEPDGRTAIDFGDTWYELQLGGTAKLSDNSLLYASFERSFGGDVQEKWRVDAGLRFSF
ncbi:MAG: autotransporter outer membrane beta-barrel domain-containing protein, partial [Phascolarctobacterium sp.]|nr:autotransporter outer membrane beta-barrel domain-containing protein [Phascolarctobacterium sp.]